MPNLRRYYIPGALIFITCVTRYRAKYLESKNDVQLLFDTVQRVKTIHPFKLLAYVILPDHFHWIMRTEDSGGDFSKPMHSIKRNFTINYKKEHQIHTSIKLWQDRFWDHVIRNEFDLERHFDYIHWNPVKHKYVNSPDEWVYSSFRFWYERGYYQSGWGEANIPGNLVDMDFE